MRKRKELKQSAKKVLKKQYLLFVVVCLVASFIGSEFNYSTSAAKLDFNSSIENIEKIENSEITEIEEDTINKAKEEAIKKEEEMVENDQPGAILGRSRGIFTSIVNSVSSGAIFITIIQAISSIIKSTNVSIMIFIALSLLFLSLIWFYIVNTYKVISRRIFLEARIYPKVSKQRFLFLFKVRKWTKVAFTMFLTWLYHTLWSLTIIGGIIKYYSYYLVPYILAENPDIKPNDAITLSRQMMNHHKWECFKISLSYIGWELLGAITLGLTKILYSNPYKIATFSEYYSDLRALAIKEKLPLAEFLNDKYLYEKADSKLLEKEYANVYELMKEKDKAKKRDKGLRAFLANTFGITTYSKEEEELYEQDELRKTKISYYKEVINNESYPNRLFSIQEKEKRTILENTNYLRNYSLTSLILLFFSISFIGWIYEVSIHLVKDGTFVNRGVFYGPWLPIYGSGGVVILLILKKLRKKPLLEFITTILLCGIIEYSTAYYLEMTHNGTKWWDYSGYFLNLDGRICAEGLLVFGLGGLVIVYLAAPLLDNLFKKLNKKFAICLCTILLCLFLVDKIYSSKHPNEGKGITDYSYNYTFIKEKGTI